ncbi:uncharacterized protein FIBRA_00354 [Fibroporia radiculosa]|uniref:GST N-terminal domain-containing protein n=1 Tax=Fibroporia radiculosa TaxID=599839 RepID=J7S611_9APHY|nr:uncharacterized protein FIBRA_00354 [Fibroporia radiculosa]CCL98359.1 predicted protein [Fibroporia radiculosa]
MSSNTIVLLDIPCVVEGRAWSPNTWKTRFALNYKGLPFTVKWVEYPDIAQACKDIGADPTGTRADGSPSYTLPAIYDPSTGRGIAESALIARYLDKTYPDTPRLIPAETDAFHAAFQEAFFHLIQSKMKIMSCPTAAQLNPPSEAFYRKTRETIFGKRLEEISPEGTVRETQLKQLQEGFTKIAGWFSMDGNDKLFFMGNTISHADTSVAGWLMWIRQILGRDGPEWTAIQTWDGGRWARYMQYFEKYEVASI